MKNTSKIFLIAGFVAVIVLALSPGVVSAGIWDGISCNDTGSPCTFCEGMKLGVNIIDFLAKMAIVITAGLIVYGGAMMMISGGNQGRFSAGKGIITAAVWGLAITLLSWVIINTILVFLVKSPGGDIFAKDKDGKYSFFAFDCKSY